MTLAPPERFRGVFRTDDAALGVYSEAAGIGRVRPAAVAVPSDADDVQQLVRWAGAAQRPLIPRGSGSSMAGGAIGAGVVVDLSRLRRLDMPDRAQRRIRADAGVLRGEIERAAAAAGLRFPVDPSSGEFCTIGGMVGTNAAGAHSLRFGATRSWVRALECVFADGSRATVRRGEEPPAAVPTLQRFADSVRPQLLNGARGTADERVLKNSSGYGLAAFERSGDLVDLLVGSEGTLAIFCGVELDLTAAAGARASLLVAYDDLERAVEGAIFARESGAAACELLDRTFLAIAADAGQALPVPPATEAVLLIEVEADSQPAAVDGAARLRTALADSGATASIVAADASQELELWMFRHAASPAIARMDPSLKSMQFIEDGAVPPRQLAAYVRGIREILKRADTRGVIFGHAGDAHIHVNPLVDVRRADWRERVERILLEVTALVVELGGTLTGEHGDGRLRTPLLDQVWSADARHRFGIIKDAFDPLGILNPGVKIPLAGQRAVDVVKYDPLAPELPAAARRALDVVERERAYARWRLDLL